MKGEARSAHEAHRAVGRARRAETARDGEDYLAETGRAPSVEQSPSAVTGKRISVIRIVGTIL